MTRQSECGEITVCPESPRFSRIETMVTEMHQKLFLGNGQPSLMLRIDRVERITEGLCRIFWAVSIAGILGGLALVVKLIIQSGVAV